MARSSLKPDQAGRRIGSEADFLEGLENNLKHMKSHRGMGRGYIQRSAEMIKAKYPGSAASLLPKLRKLYEDQPR